VQDLAARAWTLLDTTYEEVAGAGLLLYKKEGGNELFPSLYSAAAKRRPRRTAKPQPGPDTGAGALPGNVPAAGNASDVS
jgi:hypothetical protein